VKAGGVDAGTGRSNVCTNSRTDSSRAVARRKGNDDELRGQGRGRILSALPLMPETPVRAVRLSGDGWDVRAKKPLMQRVGRLRHIRAVYAPMKVGG
jgi:hypothetical protein